jgi:hypothetical protein
LVLCVALALMFTPAIGSAQSLDANLAAPEMRAATGFHRNGAGLQLAEKG